MKKLVFGPKELFDEAREDFWATSLVREARKYADDRTYLRVECRNLKPDCTFEQPLQVLTLLDARRRIHGVPTDRKRVETLRKRAAEAEKMV